MKKIKMILVLVSMTLMLSACYYPMYDEDGQPIEEPTEQTQENKNAS
ncbi:MAG: hypothetical protein GXY87_07720 [Tissierellia bacterium]|nr:hypothetical protein [Tissierellia bacterium]